MQYVIVRKYGSANVGKPANIAPAPQASARAGPPEKLNSAWRYIVAFFSMMQTEGNLRIISPEHSISIGTTSYSIFFPLGRKTNKETYRIGRNASKTELHVKTIDRSKDINVRIGDPPTIDFMEIVPSDTVATKIPNLMYISDPTWVARVESWKEQIAARQAELKFEGSPSPIYSVIYSDENTLHLHIDKCAIEILKILGKSIVRSSETSQSFEEPSKTIVMDDLSNECVRQDVRKSGTSPRSLENSPPGSADLEFSSEQGLTPPANDTLAIVPAAMTCVTLMPTGLYTVEVYGSRTRYVALNNVLLLDDQRRESATKSGLAIERRRGCLVMNENTMYLAQTTGILDRQCTIIHHEKRRH